MHGKIIRSTILLWSVIEKNKMMKNSDSAALCVCLWLFLYLLQNEDHNMYFTDNATFKWVLLTLKDCLRV